MNKLNALSGSVYPLSKVCGLPYLFVWQLPSPITQKRPRRTFRRGEAFFYLLITVSLSPQKTFFLFLNLHSQRLDLKCAEGQLCAVAVYRNSLCDIFQHIAQICLFDAQTAAYLRGKRRRMEEMNQKLQDTGMF